MKNTIVRLQEIKQRNFKNVNAGTISFQSYLSKEYFTKSAEIIGLYGQNGSGKTAVIDAMRLLKIVLEGQTLPENTYDYINSSEESACLSFVFYIEYDNKKFLVDYEFIITKTEDKGVKIIKETLSYKNFFKDEWTSKSKIIDFDTNRGKTIFLPQKRYNEVVSADKDNVVNLGVAKKMSEDKRYSFIFNKDSRKIFKTGFTSTTDYFEIINSLNYFAKYNLFVISNELSGIINTNIAIPFSFKIEEENSLSFGSLGVTIAEPAIVPIQVFDTLKTIIDQMNIVLNVLVPGLTISIENYGAQLLKNGADGIKIELVSKRGDSKIPLKYESEGIKKIISVLSTIIAMYNNSSFCLVIDELDSGIFEYLLGEILKILETGAKGQLIFTSHNLRALEMINKDSLVFTTTNQNNRYIRFTNVKKNNNLRNVYLRSVDLGGQDENIYEETNSFEISRALRLAGRGAMNG